MASLSSWIKAFNYIGYQYQNLRLEERKSSSYQIFSIVAVVQDAIVLKERTITMDTVCSRSIGKLNIG